jgi:proliferating cell nuclear antigen
MSSALDGEPADLSPSLSDEALATIETQGDPIRSWARLPHAVVDEARLKIDEDGLHLTAVDAANVLMVDLHAPASGFESFEASGEFVAGLNVGRFRDALGWARKRGGDGDPVAIEFLEEPARMRVTITRENQQMQRVSEWFTLDPTSIRAEPNIPDLNLYNHATPGVDALRDAVGAIESYHDHAYLSRDGSDLLVATKADGDTTPKESDEDDHRNTTHQDAVRVVSTAWDKRDEKAAEADSSCFSLDYLDDVVATLSKAKADRVTLKWGEEFPSRIAFEYEDWGFTGHFMLAPRIQGSSPEEV